MICSVNIICRYLFCRLVSEALHKTRFFKVESSAHEVSESRAGWFGAVHCAWRWNVSSQSAAESDHSHERILTQLEKTISTSTVNMFWVTAWITSYRLLSEIIQWQRRILTHREIERARKRARKVKVDKKYKSQSLLFHACPQLGNTMSSGNITHPILFPFLRPLYSSLPFLQPLTWHNMYVANYKLLNWPHTALPFNEVFQK